jgi:DNA-binding SARP family transcriptional activator
MPEFRVLGCLDAVAGGAPVPLGSRRQRALLAVLLVHANRTTPTDYLLRALWADDPPDTAVGQIQTLVWRLRRVLPGVIATRPGGYQLSVRPGELDAHAFAARAAEGSALVRSGRLAAAAERFSAALALWRGRPFADVDLPGDARAVGLPAAVAELTEQRLSVERAHLDAALALGRHAELVPQLYRRVDTEPLREELRERLMLALYRCGRRADALEVYRRGREALVAELGLEPGGSLQRMHARILAGDPALHSGTPLDAAGPAAPPTGRRPVCQLPVDAGDFVARGVLVEALAAVLTASAPAATPAPAPPVVAIGGAAGCGKTALAVHLAHRLRPHFPDGQLFADLRGADHPLPAGDVLARFLRALGEDPRAVPADPDERAALFRARCAGRRLLVVVDNAADEAQLRPLLPAEPGCAVLVTSRSHLASLPGVHRVEVGVFTPDAALELLRRTAGSGRVAAEPADSALLVRRCGYLPLAIRIAGARLAARPHWPVSRLSAQLADERARLDVLRTGDLAVRSSLALSHDGLDEPERRVFRLLGALDAPDVAGWIAAALLDVPVPVGEELVERLVEARLLDASAPAGGPVRYRFHDLVRAYARELAEAHTTPAELAAALDRAFSAWLALADAAHDRLPGGTRRGARGCAPRWAGWRPAEVDALLADPVAWCESERAALVGVVRQAAESGRHELAWDLAATLARFFELREHLDDWRVTHETALRACGAAGNRRGEAYLLRGLGEMYLDTDRFEAALSCFAPALSLLQRLDDYSGQGLVLRAIGTAYRLQGRYREAGAALGRALKIFLATGDRVGQAQALFNIGVVHRRLDRPRAAHAAYRRALALFEELDDPFGQAYVLNSLGLLRGGQPGGDGDAERHLTRSVELCRRVGFRRGEAIALGQLGDLHLRGGAYQRAAQPLRSAVAGCREVGDRPGEAIGLRRLGELYRGLGNRAAAESSLRQCLALCADLDLPEERALALRLLGELRARPPGAGGRAG